MTGNPLLDLVALPVAFGLFGFIEPCSIGGTLIFIKVLEGKSAAEKLAQVTAFALGRAAFIGLLGVLAVLVGSAFFGFQKAAWVVLGVLYAVLGLAYVSGRIGWVARSFGPSLTRFSSARGSAARRRKALSPWPSSASRCRCHSSLPSSLRQRAERLTGWLRCRGACPSGRGSCRSRSAPGRSGSECSQKSLDLGGRSKVQTHRHPILSNGIRG